MSDKALELNINGETYRADRHNTSLFTFLGELGCYDHVFVSLAEDECVYLFKNQQIWKDLVGFIMENEFPMHFNLNEVAECDRDAYNATFLSDLAQTNTVPKEWIEHGTTA
jgi:hypothetical protein